MACKGHEKENKEIKIVAIDGTPKTSHSKLSLHLLNLAFLQTAQIHLSKNFAEHFGLF
jgi:hypothetical protein